MSTISRRGRVRAVTLAGLVAISPVIAACGGSSNGAGPSSAVSKAKSIASSALSQAPTSAIKSATSAAAGSLQTGQNVTLNGTVAQVLIPGGYLFTMTVPGQSQPVPVGNAKGANVKVGDHATVTGTVADVNVQQLEAAFGSQIPASAKATLSKLQGAKIVNATNVSTAPGSGSAAPTPSASS